MAKLTFYDATQTYKTDIVVPTPTTNTTVTMPSSGTLVTNESMQTGIQTKSIVHNASTPVSVTAWTYSSTTITLTVASHSLIVGDTIEVNGLTTTDTGTGATTTYVPNGVWTVSATTTTSISYVVSTAPTVTNKSVSSATVKGITLVNGVYGGVGVGQTWQDVTASRAVGVTYTNTTGKPIMCAIQHTQGGGTVLTVTISGVSFYVGSAGGATATSDTDTFIVPSGGTYSITGASSSLKWLELR